MINYRSPFCTLRHGTCQLVIKLMIFVDGMPYLSAITTVHLL